MKENFIVVSSGIKDGQPYATLKGIREGKSKKTGEPYAFIDDNSFMQEKEVLPLGHIVSYKRERVADDWEATSVAKK